VTRLSDLEDEVCACEQPGDREDLDGEPFVEPAGRALGEALELARDRAAARRDLSGSHGGTLGTGPVRQGHAGAGRPLDVDALYEVVLTTHPSALLRLRDRGDYTGELRRLADDLRTAVAL